jgi:hypothetical protein
MEHRQLEGSHGNYVIGGEVIDYFGVPGGGYPQPKPLLKGNPALLGLVLSPTQNTPDTKVTQDTACRGLPLASVHMPTAILLLICTLLRAAAAPARWMSVDLMQCSVLFRVPLSEYLLVSPCQTRRPCHVASLCTTHPCDRECCFREIDRSRDCDCDAPSCTADPRAPRNALLPRLSTVAAILGHSQRADLRKSRVKTAQARTK